MSWTLIAWAKSRPLHQPRLNQAVTATEMFRLRGEVSFKVHKRGSTRLRVQWLNFLYRSATPNGVAGQLSNHKDPTVLARLSDHQAVSPCGLSRWLRDTYITLSSSLVYTQCIQAKCRVYGLWRNCQGCKRSSCSSCWFRNGALLLWGPQMTQHKFYAMYFEGSLWEHRVPM